MPYKAHQREATVEDLLDKSEIEELRDELREWADNMSSTALSNTEKCQEVESAADELDCVDDLELEQLTGLAGVVPLLQDKVTYTEMRPQDKRRQPSRAYRLSNAVACIRQVLDYLDGKLEQDTEYRSCADDIESTLSDLENADIPGMY